MTRESHFSPEESSTRQRILEAAMELFSEQGFSATPIKAIARACAISDAAIFHHFRSKRDILLALWEQPESQELQHGPVELIVDSDALHRLILRSLDAAAENARFHRLVIRQQLDGDKHASAARTLAMARWRESLRRWFALYEPNAAGLMIDSFIHSLLGVVFLAEVEYGPAFVEAASRADFRTYTVDVVSRAVALDRFQRSARAANQAGAEASS